MAKVKMIVSLDEALLQKVKQFAVELNISQDQFWEMLIVEFLQRRKKLLLQEERTVVYPGRLEDR